MMQCKIFCFVIFEYNINIYNINIIIVILSLLLCCKTQRSSIVNMMAAADAFVPACLNLAVFDQAHLKSLCRLRQFLFSLN